MTRLYTLIVNPDNTYEVLIDDESKSTGSLLEDFTPPVNPPAEIGASCTAHGCSNYSCPLDDPEDKKPTDWVDTAKIADPEARKVGSIV